MIYFPSWHAAKPSCNDNACLANYEDNFYVKKQMTSGKGTEYEAAMDLEPMTKGLFDRKLGFEALATLDTDYARRCMKSRTNNA